ncbi:unnamed protein product [Rhizoctonia solani]|uniref:Protein kinase domain-containing protein n=1 Tax=Rhizoctonia solani TaxID=456999 RepID=A0A8H3BHQ3_9AGAM|nr:unnamed protein product [Rhizoctonia solani]
MDGQRFLNVREYDPDMFMGIGVQAGGQLLTCGASADVWLVNTPDVDNKCILKVVRLNRNILEENRCPYNPETAEHMWGEFINRFKSRTNQWQPLAHENIVRVLGADEEFCLRIEYLANGTASQYLAKHADNSIPLRTKMIGDVLAGLSYLHSQNPPVIHGCIRMDKLFVDAHGTTKIGEFGLANLVQGFESSAISMSEEELYRWWSPELLQILPDDQQPPYTTASDIWALGCMFFEIMSGKLPYFRHRRQLLIFRDILSNKMPGEQNDIPYPYLDFVEVWTSATSCWEREPEKRPSACSLWKQHLSQTPGYPVV